MSASDQHIVMSPWSIEPRGNGYALYAGRGPMQHGMNLVYLSEPDLNWDSTRRMIAAAPLMLAALRRQHENIQRWMETGEPAGAEESREIAEQIANAIKAAS